MFYAGKTFSKTMMSMKLTQRFFLIVKSGHVVLTVVIEAFNVHTNAIIIVNYNYNCKINIFVHSKKKSFQSCVV